MTVEDSQKKDDFQVPALERGLAIMELLASHPNGVRMREIADMLSLPPNSVFRVTGALEARGYLQRDSDMRYRLSRKLLSLGYAAIGEDKLVEHCLDVMRALRDETGETVLVGTRIDLQGVVLEQVAATNPIKFLVDPGTHFPLHTSALGKVFAAFMRPDERRALLQKMPFTYFTERTITTIKAFEQELERVVQDGFALDCAEEVEGLHCVGAPIFNHRDEVIAAIWVTGPSFRFDEVSLRIFGRKVADAAQTISSRFGHKLIENKKVS